MGWFGFGKKSATYIVALAYEGPSRLRLNGNRAEGGQVKKNAAAHQQTILWVEVAGGGRVDQGPGPAASRLPPGELERIQRDVHLSAAFKAVIEELDAGRDQASRWYKLAK